MITQDREAARIELTQHGLHPVRLHVFQLAARRQQPALLASTISTMETDWHSQRIRGGAVLRGLGGKDVASIAVLSAPTASAGTDGHEPPPDLYTVEIVDRLTGEKSSVIQENSPLFHFVNVFRVAPGKRDAMIRYLAHTIPYVRRQPGYVSTNLIVSLDGRLAVNVGQYETRRHFLAIFRQPEIIGAFARGFPQRLSPAMLAFLPRPPRLRLYELTTVWGEAQ